MKKIIPLLFVLLLYNCNKKKEKDLIKPEQWLHKIKKINNEKSLEFGKSYLSVYSQIYNMSEEKINLTAMVSMRNISDSDTIYILKAKYFDTHGKLIRTYFDQPIFLSPMETAEIIIKEVDVSGGTGSNFIFEWKIPEKCPEPLFEGIMNSTRGQQGLSFTTQGKRIK